MCAGFVSGVAMLLCMSSISSGMLIHTCCVSIFFWVTNITYLITDDDDVHGNDEQSIILTCVVKVFHVVT